MANELQYVAVQRVYTLLVRRVPMVPVAEACRLQAYAVHRMPHTVYHTLYAVHRMLATRATCCELRVV